MRGMSESQVLCGSFRKGTITADKCWLHGFIMAESRLTHTEGGETIQKIPKIQTIKKPKRTPLHGLVLLQEENFSSSLRDSQCLYGL